MRSPLIEPLYVLADSWQSATSASRRRIALAGVALAWLSSVLVARQGTTRARVGAAVVIVASAAVAVGWRIFERRRLRQPARIVHALVRGLDREGADRALRALSLIGPDGQTHHRGTSVELAELHVARAIAQLPTEEIVERAEKVAIRVRQLALVGFVLCLGIAFAQPWSVLEGADVLTARHGVAPFAMRWLDEVEVVARPPDYLHESEQHGPALMTLVLPYGTQIAVRGVPAHAGRRLFLRDGTTEVPFVDDGAGGVVARWQLGPSTSLRVVARFGEVAIGEPDALEVESLPDAPPTVTVEGAPRQVLLVDQNDDDIPVRYEAVDDHGLREVELVLRSGTREERRVLTRLDGETKRDKGGYVLKLRDPFLKKSHAPIEVTVEAKDNDPLTGPKWGASPPLVLVPPNVGEPEARRVEALRRLRDALVDSLAWRLSNDPPIQESGRAAFVAEESERASADGALLTQTLTESYAGLRVPLRVRATLVAAGQKVRGAVDRETRAPSAGPHAEVVKATERFVLVVDAVVRGLGLRDARESARQLADVADDLALGASQAQGDDAGGRHPSPPSRGAIRMDAASAVLSDGSGSMKRLGMLGRDLGEIVVADLGRVKRARDAADPVHAELSARDLAARLRQPDPSFGARGGRMGGTGSESGGGGGTMGGEADVPSDEVDRAFEEAARDIDQLAQDHAGEIGKMEQALAGATSEEELEELRKEAKRHAEAIRDAVRGLPSVGNGSDSWTSKGAAARELAEQMARSLERAQAEDAAQSGRSALGSLDEAKKMLQKGGWIEDPTGENLRRVEDARRKLDAEEKWAERELEQMRRRAADRARKQLQSGGDDEGKLADRARDLAQRARDRGSLPQEAIESVDDAERAARQAAEALRQGDADRGLEHQHDAQRALEAANEQLQGEENEGSDQSSSGPQDSGEARGQARKGNVPKAGQHRGPEEFRKRVVRGLGQPAGGGLKEAVRRYAEGLLR